MIIFVIASSLLIREREEKGARLHLYKYKINL